MTGFRLKKITNPPTLGEKLRNVRNNLGLNLKEVSGATNIAMKYLNALEAGDYFNLPGEAYAKSFLKVYSAFLGQDAREFVAIYETEQKIYAKTQKNQNGKFNQPVKIVSSAHLMVTPRVIRSAIVGALALAILVYLGIKMVKVITPPLLIIDQPTENLITNDNFVEVAGRVRPETTLEINGTRVFADQFGEFKETIDLQAGVNIIEIVAEKRHGKQTKKYLQVVVN
ncbi:MAG TPA: helix-turn-helix domain-containing protein [Patescibacteria group bacterium]|nr:helix-turn-helix domain-containing protein [Patescibacteria group bacterium]